MGGAGVKGSPFPRVPEAVAMTSSGCGCVCGCQVSFGVLSSHKFPVCVPPSSRVWQPLYSFVGCAKKRENTRTHKKRKNTLKWIKKAKFTKKKKRENHPDLVKISPPSPTPPAALCSACAALARGAPPRAPPAPALPLKRSFCVI